jgi:hypothetical protein
MSGRSVALIAGVWIPALFIFGGILVVPIRWNKSRLYGQEAAALKAIQTLNTAQVQYKSEFGRYARSLTELAVLAASEKQGYKFTLMPTPEGYSIQAVPTAFGVTGSRTFYSDQSLVIRQNYGPEPATPGSREVGRAAR